MKSKPKFTQVFAKTAAINEEMAKLGVEFGQIPVSDYFWQAISPMQSPRDFVTGLSLTLEQANLDYAVHYAQIYQNLDDGDTAAILEQIYRDEITHVKHGLHWFEQWRDEGLTQWQAYEKALPQPLSPASVSTTTTDAIAVSIRLTAPHA